MALRHASLLPRALIVVHFAGHIERAANPCYPGFLFRCLQVPHVIVENGTVRIREADVAHNQDALDQYAEYNRYIAGAGGPWSRLSDIKWRMLHDIASSAYGTTYVFKRRVPDVAEKAIIARHLYAMLKEVADSQRTPLLVAYLPDYFSNPVPPMPEYMRAVFADLAIQYVDLHPDAVDAQRDDRERIKVPNEGHLNAIGHEMIATRLAPIIGSIVGLVAAPAPK